MMKHKQPVRGEERVPLRAGCFFPGKVAMGAELCYNSSQARQESG